MPGASLQPGHETAYRRIVDFVHDFSAAKIGLQLGHSGRKGSTRLMWEGIDEPLTAGNWPVGRLGAALPPGRTRCRESSRVAEMGEIREQFVQSAEMGLRPGSTCSSCTARTATCSPASSRR